MGCPTKNCKGTPVKEKFPEGYKGIEASKLHCGSCGLWFNEKSSDKNKTEKSD